MNSSTKNLILLTITSLFLAPGIQASNTTQQEPLVLKITNKSKQSATLSEIEYSYGFKINNITQKAIVPNTTKIEFMANQTKQLAINVSIPTPSAPKGATVNFVPIGITAIKIYSTKNKSNNKSIPINPPYYHLNIANTGNPTPSICINYSTKKGWYAQPCPQIKAHAAKSLKPGKKTKTVTTINSKVPAIPKETSASTLKTAKNKVLKNK